MPHPGEEQDVAEEHGEEPHGVEQRGRVRHAEGPSREQRQVQHRGGVMPAAVQEGCPHDDRGHQADHHPSARPTPRRPFRDGQDQRRQRGAHEHHTQVVGVGPPLVGLGIDQHPAAQEPGHGADREVHVERPAPPARRDQQGPQGRARGHRQRPHASPHGDHLRTPFGREGAEQESQRRRQHGGGPGALDQAPRHQEADGRGQPAQRRSQAEHGQPGEEDPPAPDPVCAAPRRDQQRPEHDAVPGDHPGQRGPANRGGRTVPAPGRPRSRWTGRVTP